MQYPIRKTMLIACLALASVAIAAKTISKRHHTDYSSVAAISAPSVAPAPAPAPAGENSNVELYNDLDLAVHGMDPEVLDMALKGFGKLSAEGKIPNTDKITIVDFSQPSDQKRLYVIDLQNKQLLFQ